MEEKGQLGAPAARPGTGEGRRNPLSIEKEAVCALGRISNFWAREISDIGYKILVNLRRQNIRRTEEYVSSSSLSYNFNACSVCISAYTEFPCISLTPKILQIGNMPVYSKGALRRQESRSVQ